MIQKIVLIYDFQFDPEISKTMPIYATERNNFLEKWESWALIVLAPRLSMTEITPVNSDAILDTNTAPENW